MTILPQSFVEIIEGVTGRQNCGCDPCCPDQSQSAEGPWMVTVTPHHAGRAILRSSPETLGYGPSDAGTNWIMFLDAGTPLTVLDTTQDMSFYRVVTADGQEGWIGSGRTAYLSGLCLGHPFIDRWDGRDGSPRTALIHARTIMNGELKGSDYANRCLRFVSDCYNITGVQPRCPLMYNPGRCGYAGNAIGAYRALQRCAKMLPLISPLPTGAIVFWGPSGKNGNHGHVAIALEDGVQIITSGFVTSAGVPTNVEIMESVAAVATWTGAIALGYTTPEVAFTPGSWGAASPP
ncbi:SH3 domain-containing protein [Polyangium spumosum]|uniref:Uncharacterized protein n=1 Tax=Polyangium spumosum TaxID=889282 RepID=A0A6N7Q274_9BACT|nr:SH3 domain-containing protein [Polyangium spumosum]MRG96364.1 hypothetical protein [Polyangium spumosum]